MDNPVLHKLVGVESLTPRRCVLFDSRRGFEDIQESFPIVSQRATASASTRSLIRPLSPLAVTTSTGSPSRSERSASNSARSRRLRSLSKSTRMSMSLDSSAVPRATEPKSRTFCAPCRAASARICPRCRFNWFNDCTMQVWSGDRRLSRPSEVPDRFARFAMRAGA